MSAEVVKSTSTTRPDVVAAQTKLVGAHFVASIPFANESLHVATAGGNPNADLIAPARLLADGTAQPISGNERSDGLLVRKAVHDRLNGGRPVVTQCFVPWSNVRGLVYAEPT